MMKMTRKLVLMEMMAMKKERNTNIMNSVNMSMKRIEILPLLILEILLQIYYGDLHQ
jgi:hypothetical protein